MTQPILICDRQETYHSDFVISPIYIAKTMEDAIKIIYREALQHIPEDPKITSFLTEDFNTLEFDDEDFPAWAEGQIIWVERVTLDWVEKRFTERYIPFDQHVRMEWYLITVKEEF